MFKFSKQYPVFGKLTSEQWSWLCDRIGKPQKDFVVSRGAVWFKDEKHKILYLLRWT